MSQHEAASAINRVEMSQSLRNSLQRALSYADEQAHRQVTLEHLLLAFVDDREAAVILETNAVDVTALMTDVSDYIGRLDDRISAVGAGQRRSPGLGADVQHIIQSAGAAAQKSGRHEIGSALVLAAIVGDGRSPAAQILRNNGLTFQNAIDALKVANAAAAQQNGSPQSAPSPQARPSPAPSPVPNKVSSTVPNAATIAAPTDARLQNVQAAHEIIANARERIAAARGAVAARSASLAASSEALSAPSEIPNEPSAHREASPVSAVADPIPIPSASHHLPIARDDAAVPTVSTVEPVQQVRQPRPLASSSPEGSPRWEPTPTAPPHRVDRPPHEGAWRQPAQPTQMPAQPHQMPPHPQQMRQPLPAEQSGFNKRAEFSGDPARMPPTATTHQHSPAAPTQAPLRNDHPPHPQAFRPQPEPRLDRGHSQPMNTAAHGGPGWRPEEAAQLRQPQNNQPTMQLAGNTSENTAGRSAANRTSPSAIPVDPEQLALAIPRRMRVGRSTTIEVRAPRAGLEAWSGGTQDPRTREDEIITKAMAMRLKAPKGGFSIEIASPETQWSERHLDPLSDDIVSWRWIVTPASSGRQPLQLSTSTRVVCRDGLAAATSLPEQNVIVRVAPDYARITGKLALWVFLAASGLALGHFGESLFAMGSSMIAQAIQR